MAGTQTYFRLLFRTGNVPSRGPTRGGGYISEEEARRAIGFVLGQVGAFAQCAAMRVPILDTCSGRSMRLPESAGLLSEGEEGQENSKVASNSEFVQPDNNKTGAAGRIEDLIEEAEAIWMRGVPEQNRKLHREVTALHNQNLSFDTRTVRRFQIHLEHLTSQLKDRILAYKGVADARRSPGMLSQDRIDEFRDRIVTTVGLAIQTLQEHINRDHLASGTVEQLPPPSRFTDLHQELIGVVNAELRVLEAAGSVEGTGSTQGLAVTPFTAARVNAGSEGSESGGAATSREPKVAEESTTPKFDHATVARESRAQTVATLIRELDQLKPQMLEDDSEYARLCAVYPTFLTFKIAAGRPDLRSKVLGMRSSTRHIRLAQELAGAHHGRQLSTIQDDWKDHKPKGFRRPTV